MPRPTAIEYADSLVTRVLDDPAGRLALLRRLYDVPADPKRRHLPYRRAASAFMEWQLRRGLLNPPDAANPGSPWWRAVNEALLRDTSEARAIAFGRSGEPSGPAVAALLHFIERPTARNWYRAHNTTIASAYLGHEPLARPEGRVERFFINLVLIRVLYAHALVAAPRLALGWLAPVAPQLGDPRLGMTSIFLSLSRVLPDRYPVGDDVERYVLAEHGFGHLLDVGVIQPRLRRLFDWSAAELGLPELGAILVDGIPGYAWDNADAEVWQPHASRLARMARRAVPPV